jgi:hypothetical protein
MDAASVGAIERASPRKLKVDLEIEKGTASAVEQFIFLPHFHTFNRHPQLLANLVVRIAEQISNPRIDVEQSIDAAQTIFARSLFVFGINARNHRFIHMPAERWISTR